MHYLVHLDKVTLDSSTDWGGRAAAAGGLSHMGRGTALLQTSPQDFERFLAPGNPGREWGMILVYHIQDTGE